MDNNSNLEMNYYLVAFIDVLGQQNALQKMNRLPDQTNEEEMLKFRTAIKNTVGNIYSFRDFFKKYFDSYNQKNDKSPFANIFTSNDIKFQRFSDCFIMFSSLKSEINKASVQNVFSVVASCASVFLLWLSMGRPLRGAIEVGTGLEIYENEIYGYVLSEAYRLESKVAQYPRIVIGHNLVNYLMMTKLTKENDIYSEFNRGMASCCLDMIVQDVDGHPIVDYLGEGFKKYVAKDIIDEIPIKAYDFLVKQSERYQKERNTNLAFRYNLLRDYFEARLSLWGQKSKDNETSL